MQISLKFLGSRTLTSKFIVLTSLAILGLFIALFVYKFFRLALTIPLLLVGASSLLIGFAIRTLPSGNSPTTLEKTLKAIRVLAIFSGLIFVMLSFGFILINLIAFASASKTDESNRYKNLGRYSRDNSSFWLRDELLGYKYKQGEKGITSRSVLVDQKDIVKDVIYDVTYNIDESGNRISGYPEDYDRSAVFVGGSFTFGEGLQDSESLPSFFALKSGFRAYNLGMHGYGPHQGLMQLSHPELRKERFGSEKIDIVFYRFIVDHISRVAGYSSWDPIGPCYQLNENNTLDYVGNFEECKSSLKTVLIDPVLKKLSTSNELWTTRISKKLLNYRPSQISENDLQNFIAVVKAMKEESFQMGAEFVVLIEDVYIQKSDNQIICKINKTASQVSKMLEREGVTALPFSSFYSSGECVNGEYVIRPFVDNHPSRTANERWSDQILKFVD